jgi:hypothetical protein
MPCLTCHFFGVCANQQYLPSLNLSSDSAIFNKNRHKGPGRLTLFNKGRTLRRLDAVYARAHQGGELRTGLDVLIGPIRPLGPIFPAGHEAPDTRHLLSTSQPVPLEHRVEQQVVASNRFHSPERIDGEQQDVPLAHRAIDERGLSR